MGERGDIVNIYLLYEQDYDILNIYGMFDSIEKMLDAIKQMNPNNTYCVFRKELNDFKPDEEDYYTCWSNVCLNGRGKRMIWKTNVGVQLKDLREEDFDE